MHLKYDNVIEISVQYASFTLRDNASNSWIITLNILAKCLLFLGIPPFFPFDEIHREAKCDNSKIKFKQERTKSNFVTVRAIIWYYFSILLLKTAQRTRKCTKIWKQHPAYRRILMSVSNVWSINQCNCNFGSILRWATQRPNFSAFKMNEWSHCFEENRKKINTKLLFSTFMIFSFVCVCVKNYEANWHDANVRASHSLRRSQTTETLPNGSHLAKFHRLLFTVSPNFMTMFVFFKLINEEQKSKWKAIRIVWHMSQYASVYAYKFSLAVRRCSTFCGKIGLL